LLTHRQTDRQTNKQTNKVWQNITFLAEVINTGSTRIYTRTNFKVKIT